VSNSEQVADYFGRGGFAPVVVEQAPVPLQPAAGALHDLAAGHRRESPMARGLFPAASRSGSGSTRPGAGRRRPNRRRRGYGTYSPARPGSAGLLDHPPGRFHGLARRGRPAASHRYQRRVSVCGPELLYGRQGLCPAHCI